MGVSDKVPRKDAMGSGQSIISKEDMEAYKELTYFTEAEVKECLKRFIALIDPKPDLKQTNIHDQQVSHKHIIEGLQELRVNPFADRICMVFSRVDQLMRFEEFLDMLSSMSAVAPQAVRAEWAFRMFDYDGDGLLGAGDIRRVVDAVTGTDTEALPEQMRQKVVKNVLDETDLNRTGQISLAEFKQMVIRSPDFADNFRIRL